MRQGFRALALWCISGRSSISSAVGISTPPWRCCDKSGIRSAFEASTLFCSGAALVPGAHVSIRRTVSWHLSVMRTSVALPPILERMEQRMPKYHAYFIDGDGRVTAHRHQFAPIRIPGNGQAKSPGEPPNTIELWKQTARSRHSIQSVGDALKPGGRDSNWQQGKCRPAMSRIPWPGRGLHGNMVAQAATATRSADQLRKVPPEPAFTEVSALWGHGVHLPEPWGDQDRRLAA